MKLPGQKGTQWFPTLLISSTSKTSTLITDYRYLQIIINLMTHYKYFPNIINLIKGIRNMTLLEILFT